MAVRQKWEREVYRIGTKGRGARDERLSFALFFFWIARSSPLAPARGACNALRANIIAMSFRHPLVRFLIFWGVNTLSLFSFIVNSLIGYNKVAVRRIG
jgi:hypothetical protein